MTHPYATATYAKAFAYDYEAFALKEADSHVLLRPIPGSDAIDALGVYPLCPLKANADLSKDFAELKSRGAVSLVLVNDPFVHPPLELLQQQFDRVTPFKEHFLCDLSKPHEFTKHHRYEVRYSRKQCEVRVISLKDALDDWYALYETLITKHGMKGIQAFPKRYFADICALEPITVGAYMDGALASAHIWFRNGDVAYSHLAASSETGYKSRAAYAVYDESITHLKGLGVKIIDLGGGAGNEASKGLTFLKQGFSNSSVMAHLCAKVLDEKHYAELSKGKETNFFPAYRG